GRHLSCRLGEFCAPEEWRGGCRGSKTISPFSWPSEGCTHFTVLCFLAFLASGFASVLAISRRADAAAVYLTTSFSSPMYSSTVSSADGSPRRASASSAAARTIQLLSPAASSSTLVVAGSGSSASTLAAAARTGEAIVLPDLLDSFPPDTRERNEANTFFEAQLRHLLRITEG